MLDVTLGNDINRTEEEPHFQPIKSLIYHVKTEIRGRVRNQEGERIKSIYGWFSDYFKLWLCK